MKNKREAQKSRTPLFPQDSKVTIQQGRAGDCYLLSALDCILHDKKGYEYLQSLFTQTENGVILRLKKNDHSQYLNDHFKNRNQHGYIYQPNDDHKNDIDEFFIPNDALNSIDTDKNGVTSNSLAIKILERISTYYYKTDKDKERENEIQRENEIKYKNNPFDSISIHNQSGDRFDTSSTKFVGQLLGIKTEDIPGKDIHKIIEFKYKNPNEPIYISMGYAKKDESGKFHGRHALRLDTITITKDSKYHLKLVNPWNNDKIEEYIFTLDELKERNIRFSKFPLNEKIMSELTQKEKILATNEKMVAYESLKKELLKNDPNPFLMVSYIRKGAIRDEDIQNKLNQLLEKEFFHKGREKNILALMECGADINKIPPIYENYKKRTRTTLTALAVNIAQENPRGQYKLLDEIFKRNPELINLPSRKGGSNCLIWAFALKDMGKCRYLLEKGINYLQDYDGKPMYDVGLQKLDINQQKIAAGYILKQELKKDRPNPAVIEKLVLNYHAEFEDKSIETLLKNISPERRSEAIGLFLKKEVVKVYPPEIPQWCKTCDEEEIRPHLNRLLEQEFQKMYNANPETILKLLNWGADLNKIPQFYQKDNTIASIAGIAVWIAQDPENFGVTRKYELLDTIFHLKPDLINVPSRTGGRNCLVMAFSKADLTGNLNKCRYLLEKGVNYLQNYVIKDNKTIKMYQFGLQQLRDPAQQQIAANYILEQELIKEQPNSDVIKDLLVNYKAKFDESSILYILENYVHENKSEVAGQILNNVIKENDSVLFIHNLITKFNASKSIDTQMKLNGLLFDALNKGVCAAEKEIFNLLECGAKVDRKSLPGNYSHIDPKLEKKIQNFQLQRPNAKQTIEPEKFKNLGSPIQNQHNQQSKNYTPSNNPINPQVEVNSSPQNHQQNFMNKVKNLSHSSPSHSKFAQFKDKVEPASEIGINNINTGHNANHSAPKISKQQSEDYLRKINGIIEEVSKFEVGFFGGKEVIINGEKTKVPHHVKTIYEIINNLGEYKNKSLSSGEKCQAIRDQADHAVKNKSFGRSDYTLNFYTNIQGGVYLKQCADTNKTVEQADENKKQVPDLF